MLGAGALGRPRGMVWGGRREEGSGWGTHVWLFPAARRVVLCYTAQVADAHTRGQEGVLGVSGAMLGALCPLLFHPPDTPMRFSAMHLRQKENSNQNGVDWSGTGRLEGPGGGYILHTRAGDCSPRWTLR